MGGVQKAVRRGGVVLAATLTMFGGIFAATAHAAGAASGITMLRPTFSFDPTTGTMTITAPPTVQDEFTIFLAQRADHSSRIAVTDDGFAVDANGDPSADNALGGFQKPANTNCGTSDVYDAGTLVQNIDDDTALIHCDATKVHKVVIFGGDRADSFDVTSDDPADNVPTNISVELHGGPGPDEFDGGYTNDTIYGDSGADTYSAADDNDGADYIDLGTDTDTDPDSANVAPGDTVDYSFSTAVTVKLFANSETNPAGDHDTLLNVEDVVGTNAADEIWGNDGPNDLEGGDGNDKIHGMGGNDQLYGQMGDDTLWGGAGADYIDGGQETNTVSYDDHNLGVNVDLQRDSGNGSAEDGLRGDTDYFTDNIIGSAHNDVLLGNGDANEIHGGAGSDLINGRGYFDKIYGEGDSDLIDARDNTADPVIDCGNSPGGEVVLFDAGLDHPVGCPAMTTTPPAKAEVVIANGARTMKVTTTSAIGAMAWTTKSDGTLAYGYTSTTPLTGNVQMTGTNPAPLTAGAGCTAMPNYQSAVQCPNISAIQLVGSNYSDFLYALAAVPTAMWGDGGADQLQLNSTPGAVAGGPGNDHITTNDSIAQWVDCGADNDTLVADHLDAIANCETVTLR